MHRYDGKLDDSIFVLGGNYHSTKIIGRTPSKSMCAGEKSGCASRVVKIMTQNINMSE